MNQRFIENCHNFLKYERKEGTKGSFYQAEGKKGILPERLSWGMYSICKASNKDSLKINEINGQYKKNESGAYKVLNKGKIHTSIWKGLEDYPEFYGYGIIDERFDIYDLLIIYSENICTSSFEIHTFRGMGKPEFMETAFNYLRELKKKKPYQNKASKDILNEWLFRFVLCHRFRSGLCH
jgi:hypothetical protein